MIRVAIVDDDALMRAGLRAILSSAEDIQVVGEADDGTGVPELVRSTQPDLLVMDIRMPRIDGIEATRRLMATPDPPRVLVLTTFRLDEHVFAAIEAGASGFLLKDTPPSELVEAVRIVAGGDAMLSPAHTRALIERFADTGRDRRRDTARALLTQLSTREREVAEFVAEGLSNAEIGDKLFCSEATVKTHLTHVFAKIGDSNRVRLALLVRDASA
ncbi:response regulator transcription factor [Tessaracoccus caeni]|uniref:response regulator transcription factor n=1 Tax=Tessaracoccus caeni TaxID=3031239 RepID=UPI0023DC90A3|nr:response regulator transcription factor [Tessaracoccus caeni]MDF1488714.1 response regulator transcription factor [Tessaracoccus caeni]